VKTEKTIFTTIFKKRKSYKNSVIINGNRRTETRNYGNSKKKKQTGKEDLKETCKKNRIFFTIIQD